MYLTVKLNCNCIYFILNVDLEVDSSNLLLNIFFTFILHIQLSTFLSHSNLKRNEALLLDKNDLAF